MHLLLVSNRQHQPVHQAHLPHEEGDEKREEHYAQVNSTMQCYARLLRQT